MKEKNAGLEEAIEMAMQAEAKAKKFYGDAVAKVSNEREKNLLKQLADFEQQHYDKLKELKESLARDGKYIDYKGTEFASYQSKALSEGKEKIEANKDEILEILNIAINSEKEAWEHYTAMAEKTEDVKGKEMFLKLADEETLHRRILSDEFYQLSNEGGIWMWGE